MLSYAAVVDGDKLVISYMEDVKETLKIFTLQGEWEKDIDLPGIGSIASISAKKKLDFFCYSFTSFTYPGSVFFYSFSSPSPSPLLLTSTHIEGFDPSDFEVEQHFYSSSDLSRIPIFLIYPSVCPLYLFIPLFLPLLPSSLYYIGNLSLFYYIMTII